MELEWDLHWEIPNTGWYVSKVGFGRPYCNGKLYILLDNGYIKQEVFYDLEMKTFWPRPHVHIYQSIVKRILDKLPSETL